jgi:hypothetical protein
MTKVVPKPKKKAAARIKNRRPLPVAELNPLVARLAAAPNRASGDALRKQILEGFYGAIRLPAAKVAHRKPKPAANKPSKVSAISPATARRLLAGPTFSKPRRSWANLPDRLAELKKTQKVPAPAGEPLMRDLVDVFCAGVRAAKETGASSADTIAAFAEALSKIYRRTKPTQAAAEYGMTAAEIADAGKRMRRASAAARRPGEVRAVSGVDSLRG